MVYVYSDQGSCVAHDDITTHACEYRNLSVGHVFTLSSMNVCDQHALSVVVVPFIVPHMEYPRQKSDNLMR